MSRRKDKLAHIRALQHSSPNGPDVARHAAIRMAFEQLRRGTAVPHDFDRVAMAVNVALVRALEIDDTILMDLRRAQTAMGTVRDRYTRIKKFVLLPQECVHLGLAMDIQEAIYEASSPLQMQKAHDISAGVIMKERQNHDELNLGRAEGDPNEFDVETKVIE